MTFSMFSSLFFFCIFFSTLVTRVSPKISINATSGEICLTTSSHDQCSLANLTRYNVSIADVTGNQIFKSEDLPESSCLITLLLPRCGPFKISALAFDDYITYDYVHHEIEPGNSIVLMHTLTLTHTHTHLHNYAQN